MLHYKSNLAQKTSIKKDLSKKSESKLSDQNYQNKSTGKDIIKKDRRYISDTLKQKENVVLMNQLNGNSKLTSNSVSQSSLKTDTRSGIGEFPSTPTLRINRKSAEGVNGATPKKDIQRLCSNLNNSHPPLVRSTQSTSSVNFKSTPRTGTKQPPSTPGTPKGLLRTPRNTGTPRTSDGESKRCSLSEKREHGTKVRISLENSSQNRCTPVSTSISVSLATPVRKSCGSAQKNVQSSLRRSSSARKSALSNALPFNNTPINFRQRLSNQDFWSTPTTPSDLYNLRKADIHNGALNSDDWDLLKEDESSRVSVVVRIRPINNRERSNPNIRNITGMHGNDVQVYCENGNVNLFSFDRCFWSCDGSHPNYASQEQVYVSVAQPLLDHAYEGYNICLFAYGQTGSGKSYCIMGEEQECGIIPRFCQELFTKADFIHSSKSGMDSPPCKVDVEISYIEIYNEKIYDLICWQNCPTGDEEQRVVGSSMDKRDPLPIREHPINGPYVVGASCHLVTSYEDLEMWINLGNKQRSIAATGMNDKSSRSHSVFSIRITQTQVETIEEEEMEHSLASLINIVDLAGSERVAAAHSGGDRLKEGVCINKSLLTLGKVITALAECGGKRKVFIPYRESTLTWLLKESLGGNSKTTMIATVSPCNIHQEETLSTLRYAQQARKIVNWNRINEDPTSKIIRALKLEVERLRALQMSPRPLLLDEAVTREEVPKDGGLQDTETKEGTLEEERKDDGKSEKGEEERKIIHAKEIEINFLKEKLRATQEQFSERAKLYEDKLLEAELRKKEALEKCRMRGLALKVEENQPTLVNLCEDPQLSQTLLYSLKKGSTTLGTSNADVTLCGLQDTGTHCSILYEKDKLVLYPIRDTETFVNGKLVTVPTQIFHNDRIVLGGIHFFRVCFSACLQERGKETRNHRNKFDFLYARDELLREQEERIRKEMSQQQAATRAEMMRELEEQKLELQLQEMAMKESVKALSSELEDERMLSQETEMARILAEEEKQFLEGQVKALKRLNSQATIERNFHPPSPTDNHFLTEMEAIFDESMQIVESNTPDINTVNVELWFLVGEANNLCCKLKKPYEFQQQTRLNAHGLEVIILAHDTEHHLSASLEITQLKHILNLLRDLVSGDQDDDSLLSAAIPWEREENISKVPFIQNKLRENIRRLSINQSINSSFCSVLNNSISGSSVASRRLSLRRSSIKPIGYAANPQPNLTNPHNVLLAKGASQAFLKFVPPSKQNSPFVDAFLHVLQVYNVLLEFSSHSIKDDLSDPILRLVMLTPSLGAALHRLGNDTTLSKSGPGTAADIQAQIAESGSKLLRKMARMMQGVETGVETLVEEESCSIMKFLHELVEQIGHLNLIVTHELPEGGVLVTPTLSVCQSYLIGVSRGLEWKVGKASKWAESAASVFASPIHNSSPNRRGYTNISKHAMNAITAVASFLSYFSQLKVEPDIRDIMALGDAKKEASRFLGRVMAASENVQELVSALASITQEFGDPEGGSLQFESLGEAVVRLQESLGELVDDAGVGSSFERKKERTSRANLVDTSVELFLETLHTQAMQAFKRIKALRTAVSDAERSERAKGSNSHYTLETEMTYPRKSSFKQQKVLGEKKVRFNVSLSSSLVGSFIEEEPEEK